MCKSSASLQALSPHSSHSSSGLGKGSGRSRASPWVREGPSDPLVPGQPGPQQRKHQAPPAGGAALGPALCTTVAHLCVLFARCQEKPLCLLLLPVSSAPAWGPHPSWGAPAPAPASALPGVIASSTATLPRSFPPLLSLLSPPASCVEVTSTRSVLRVLGSEPAL